MRIKNKTKALRSVLKVKFLNQRIPLAVRWQLTNRCVWRCKYCVLWKTEVKEPSLEEIISVLDELARAGTQTISYSGGEPMLREDIGEILRETKKRNISTEMNSTGAFVPHYHAKLKDLDFLKISLDGNRAVHDEMRGKGSYAMAIEAAHAAQSNKLRFSFTTTLTKFNLDQIDFLVQRAQEYKTFVAFQPVKSLYRGISDISGLAPGHDEFRQAVLRIIRLKKEQGPCIRNSLQGLRHVINWPSYGKLSCWAGKIFCIINTDGTLMPCDRISYKETLPNCLKEGFLKVFFDLPGVTCAGCGFCGVLELNFLMAMKIRGCNAILKVIQ